MEWVVDFVCNIIGSIMDLKIGVNFLVFGVILLMYIFVLNMLGLLFFIIIGYEFWWKFLIVDFVIILMLVVMVVVLIYYYGVKMKGFKEYFKDYLRFVLFMFLMKIIEEFVNMLIFGLRFYGNIFVGEIFFGLFVGLVISYYL